MKKLIAKILVSTTAFIAGIGFISAPLYAHAEEPIVSESLIEENSVNESYNSVQTPTISDSSTVEEIPKTSESVENSDDVEHNFKDFLAWAEQEAERYGYGDKFTAAVEAITTAATQKQVTLSTIWSVAVTIAIIAYTIYKKVTDAKFKAEVSNLSNTLHDQLTKMNELVEGTNNNTKAEEEIKAEEEKLKEEEIKIKNSLSYLINAFMHFSSHVGMSEIHKDEVKRDCIKALNCIDGEVKADEDHKE